MLTNEHICVIIMKNKPHKGDVIMSKESKIFSAQLWSAQETVTHYESFGWELLSLNGNQIVMSRESQNPVYPELVKYQSEYEAFEAEYKSVKDPQMPAPYEPVNYMGAFIGLLCFIIPGAIYIAYKVNKKKEYDEAMNQFNDSLAKARAKRDELRRKMKETAEKSRALFFSRQG